MERHPHRDDLDFIFQGGIFGRVSLAFCRCGQTTVLSRGSGRSGVNEKRSLCASRFMSELATLCLQRQNDRLQEAVAA
jgi:hypothetical protein